MFDQKLFCGGSLPSSTTEKFAAEGKEERDDGVVGEDNREFIDNKITLKKEKKTQNKNRKTYRLLPSKPPGVLLQKST